MHCSRFHRIFTSEPILYDLRAVIHHYGSAHRGHYKAFVHNTDGGWVCFNDEEVTPVGIDDVLTDGAYILSYAKRFGASVG